MKSYAYIFSLLMIFSLPTKALAVGVPVGTVINNQAQVDAMVDGNPVNLVSNFAAFTVDEVLNLTLTWQDATNVMVRPGETGQMLTFLLTNTGNGAEDFYLTIDNAIAGDQFEPQSPLLYLDTNGNSNYDPGTDQAYDPVSNLPLLAPDQGINLFIFNDIPSGLNDNDLGISQLLAEATTGSGSPGTIFFPALAGDPVSIVGTSGARAGTDGIYEVTLVAVALTKTVQINDPNGGNQPLTGATLTYAILIEVTGLGTATALVVQDLIPANTSYVTGSMTLFDGTATKTLSDQIDLDEGAFIESPPGTGSYEVSFALGDLTNTTQTVTFQVTID